MSLHRFTLKNRHEYPNNLLYHLTLKVLQPGLGLILSSSFSRPELSGHHVALTGDLLERTFPGGLVQGTQPFNVPVPVGFSITIKFAFGHSHNLEPMEL